MKYGLVSRFSVMLLVLGLCVSVEAETFDGYQCTDDCSGHQAGYDWAEEHNITNDSACSTNSQSFNEGCESYVNGGNGTTTADDEDDDEEEEDE
ncbi:hypothetical protein [Pseudomonas citronellolis]|uniref:hypothetical protein n=1 Tax=Pseudomonas citronellolis TaxID=53408 RepID=UPI0021C0ADA4|nr:hypothetical protein [Pseudomonas citronellolis]UXJ55050.1 hypothetical protein N5P21_12875 [Pseudomonas citronellolis]